MPRREVLWQPVHALTQPLTHLVMRQQLGLQLLHLLPLLEAKCVRHYYSSAGIVARQAEFLLLLTLHWRSETGIENASNTSSSYVDCTFNPVPNHLPVQYDPTGCSDQLRSNLSLSLSFHLISVSSGFASVKRRVWKDTF